MKHHVALGLSLIAPLLLSACFSTQITFASPAKVAPSAKVNKTWYHGAAFGLAEVSDPVQLNNACPMGKVAVAEQKTSFANALVEGLTGHWYNPQTVTVTCSAE